MAPTQQIYVSPTGSNAADGSAGHPFRTIQHAVDEATPGVAIMVTAGTYIENVRLPTTGGTTAAPIWLISADGPQAARIVAANKDAPTIKGLGTDNYVIKDFLISGGSNGIQLSQSGNDFTNLVSNVVVDGNVVVGTKEDGIKVSQADNVTISNNTISKVGQEGIDFVAVNNSTITHNEVSQVYGTSAGIFAKGGSTHVRITNNYVHDVKADGIIAGGWSSFTYDRSGRLMYWRPGFTGYEAKDVVISGNVVENVRKRTIDVLGAQNVNAFNNYLQANPLADFAVAVAGGSPSSPTPLLSSHVSIHDNRITAGDDPFAAAAGNTQAVTFADNETATPAMASAFLSNAGPTARSPVEATDPVGQTVVGHAGNDSLVGSNADDTLKGGSGVDTLAGGMGDDTYVVESASDTIVEKAGAGLDTIRIEAASFTLPANVENGVGWSATAVSITGNALANQIAGGTGNDTLSGGAGADILTASAGTDTLLGGDGTDKLFSKDQHAKGGLLDGGAGFDVGVIDRSKLTSSFSIDVSDASRLATANDGTRVVDVETFAIFGSAHADTLITGDGRDTLSGGAGNDRLMPGDGANVIDGGAGQDDTLLLAGSAADWQIDGRNKTFMFTSLNGHGTDQVTNVEHVVFGNTEYDLTGTASLHLLGRPGPLT